LLPLVFLVPAGCRCVVGASRLHVCLGTASFERVAGACQFVVVDGGQMPTDMRQCVGWLGFSITFAPATGWGHCVACLV
jgi:hypothetical protein